MLSLWGSRPRLSAAFQQKHMEVRGQRLGAKLPHHQCDLTPMVGGMVRQMLHQVRQTDLGCAQRQHFPQRFICQAIHEFDPFFFNLRPRSLHCSGIGKCLGMEPGFPSLSQVCDEGGARVRLLPIRKPAPLSTDDVHERVSHGTEAPAQIARELLSAETACIILLFAHRSYS